MPGPAGPTGPTGPAGSNGAGVFGTGFINPNNTNPFWLSLNGDSPQTTLNPEWQGMAMPVACTFNTLQVGLYAQSGGQTDSITVTLTKNGVDTGLACTGVSSGSAGTRTSCSSANNVAVAVGDIVGYHVTQTTGVPAVRVGIGTRCN